MFLSMYRNDSRPRNSQDDHLDAVASRHGYVFEIHQILRASRGPVSHFPSPRSGGRRRCRGPRPSGALRRHTRAPSQPRLQPTSSSAAANLIRPSWTLNVIGPGAECSSSRSPSFITSSTTFKPSPLRSVIAFRLPSCHAFSSRKRVTSAAKLKLCSGPCRGLSDSGCGLVVILYPSSNWDTWLSFPNNAITGQVTERIVALTHQTFPQFACLNRDKQDYNGSGL